jgi:hypothetical protein
MLPEINEMGRTFYGIAPELAKELGICVSCKETPDLTGRTALEIKEFKEISGICPKCWDAIFPNEDD